MTKKSRIVAGAVAAVILLGGALWGLRYALYPARSGNSLTLYGNVDIWEVQPAFNDNGPITAMYVVEGATVKKGDLIARIDDSRYAASLAQARRQADSLKAILDKLMHGSRPEEIAQARATMEGLLAIYENNQALYARTVGLLPQGIASKEDRDNAQAAVRSSRQSYEAAKQVYVLAAKGPRVEDIDAARTTYRAAAADLAEREFLDTRLYAPSDGIVEDRILEPGDMASPGTPVYTIALTDPLWVRAYVPEADLGKLTLGRRATIATDSFPGRRYRGWVGYLSPSAEFTPKTVETPELRTRLVYQVRIYACDSRGQLHLGMPATVTIDVAPAPPRAAGANAPMTMTAQTEVPEALRLEGLTRAFRVGARTVVAVNEVDATVMRGAITGLIGPDGAGKTTLMRLSLGLLRPDRGRIEVMGIDVARQPAQAQARIGYMPQRFGLYEDLTVQENLDLYARLQGVASGQRGTRYGDLLHMTGLEPFTRRLAGRLSGGMKQKLGLACTLIRVPELLVLDEPTVGVDPVSRRELWAIIDQLVRAQKITVLVSTSYLDEAERCAAVLLMHEGRLVGASSPQSFTAPLAGRTFHVAAANVGKRRLQEQLAGAHGIVDATIQGAYVRLVMQDTTPPSATALLPGVPDVSITPVAARFEDAFVALLKAAAGAASAAAAASPAPRSRAEGAHDGDGVVIAARGLTRRFGDFVAVDDVSFEVRTGEIYGLLGANGAGKTTTFRMLCGLLPPSAGTLKVAGIDLRMAAAEARRRVGYMAQRFSLYGDLSVMQNLRFFSSAYRLQGAHRRQRLDSAVQEFGLGAMLDDVARDLPLGYKQRLALACALMHEPDILFLDEPTSGVDPLARREFWRRINALAEGGVTVLVTTHFMEEAEYCDRLVIMAQGRILEAGDAASLKARARSAANPDPTMEDAFIALIGAAADRRAA